MTEPMQPWAVDPTSTRGEEREPAYLVWSNEHRAWWRGGGWGYTSRLAEAGRYSRVQALDICRTALPTAMHMRPHPMFAELPVREEDLRAFMAGQFLPEGVL